jgi:hypothetical protein
MDIAAMELPEDVLCEKCGMSAKVVGTEANKAEVAGEMTEDDVRWRDGFFFTIECPQCGTRMQCLAPPP